MSSGDTLKISITATEDKSPKRPHQAFLTLQDATTGAEDAFPFIIKDTGKGKIELVCITLTSSQAQLLTFMIDTQGPSHSIPQHRQTSQSQYHPRVLWLLYTIRPSHIRSGRNFRLASPITISRTSHPIWQARRDPPYLPSGPQKPTQDNNARLRRSSSGNTTHSDWRMGCTRRQSQSPT